MIRYFLTGFTLLVCFNLCAQIQISKLIGNNSSEFKLGYGGFLKFSYPVSEGADVTLEGGANIFQMKDSPEYGWVTIPVKAGYRYSLNQTGTGLYIEPQIGYNVYGIDPADDKFTGLIVAGGFGYLLQPGGKIHLDFGILYERAFHKVEAANYLSLRVTHNFSLRSRESN